MKKRLVRQMKDHIVSVIPARAGSKGLFEKNTRIFNGLPLYQHAVEQALASGISEVVISTDCPKIIAGNHRDGVHVVKRPKELAGDDSPMIDLLKHLMVNHITDDCTIVLLQPTSPMRRPDHILSAMKLFKEGSFDLVVSAVEVDRSILKAGIYIDGRYVPISRADYVFANRQSLPAVYKHNGAIYIFNRSWLVKNQSFETDNIGLYEMNSEDSTDIDTLVDFEHCEELLRSRNA